MSEALNSLIKRAATLRDLRRVMQLKLRRGKDYFRLPRTPEGIMTLTPNVAFAASGSELSKLGLPTVPVKNTVLIIGNPGKVYTEYPQLLGWKVPGVTGGRSKEVRNRLVYLHELHELQESTRTGLKAPTFFSHVTPGVLLKDMRILRSLPKAHRSVVNQIEAARGYVENPILKELMPNLDKVKLNARNIPRISDIIARRFKRRDDKLMEALQKEIDAL